VALSNKTVELPAELISIIQVVPAPFDPLDYEDSDRGLKTSLRGYIFGLVLVFDHFRNASDKVKNDYIIHLSNSVSISNILDFVFENLLKAFGNRSIEASRLPALNNYTPDDATTATQDIQWLLLYAYFRCIKHLPQITKSWWLSLKQKQIRTEAENCTRKYITPLVIADEFNAATEWASRLSATDEDEEGKFRVKVLAGTKEVVATYDVDEEAMKVIIRMPPTYPLTLATVEGLHRIALDEKKWKAFLMSAQGAIVFNVSQFLPEYGFANL
jgi:hypothetical protein